MSTDGGRAPAQDRRRRADYRGRVSLDLDGYRDGFETAAIRAYYNLRREADDVDVAVSSGGEGLHIVGWFERPIPPHEETRLRRQCCDDGARVEMDIERRRHGLVTGVLWHSKDQPGGPEHRGTRGVKQRDVGDVHDALDRIEATTRSDYERVKALANEGHKGAPELARRAEGL